ncbi:hypothetical protein ACFQY4_26115 [Catellatospora bangladeshensis]|uniref:hypothetical protein n=1 Tax=Catellatospora bangladeshensis TaxID=310355 RepID=UPI00361E3E06
MSVIVADGDRREQRLATTQQDPELLAVVMRPASTLRLVRQARVQGQVSGMRCGRDDARHQPGRVLADHPLDGQGLPASVDDAIGPRRPGGSCDQQSNVHPVGTGLRVCRRLRYPRTLLLKC